MAVGGVVLNFAARTAEATRDISKITRELGDVNTAAKKTGTGLGKIGKAATAGIAGVGLAAGAAAFAFVDMAKAAYADQQAQENLNRTLSRVKGVTDDAAAATSAWVDEMELATLVSDDELRVALGKLTLATDDLAEAQKIAALAQDAAVGSGWEFTSVADALAKAATGNTTALRKMFPWLDAGPDKVLTLAEAMGQLQTKYEGAAAAAAENDVFGRLGVAWGQISEAIGSAALPFLEQVSAWFSDKTNVAKVQEWVTKLGEWSTAIGTDFANEVKDFVDYLKSPAGQQAIADFTTSVGSFATAIGDLASKIDTLVGPMQRLKSATDWLPSNVLTRIFTGGGVLPSGPGLTNPANRTKSANTQLAADQLTGNESMRRPETVINVYNAKPERASQSVAAALRINRPPRGAVGAGGAW